MDEFSPTKLWRDPMALALISAWVNVPIEKLPKEMHAHTCEATQAAWGRVAAAARDFIETEGV